MSNNTATLKFLLLAVDKASKPMQHVGGEVDRTGNKWHGMSKKVLAVTAGLAVGVGAFAKSSVSAFQQVTTESRGLQRAMGGSLSEASRWRFAAQESGVDTATFTKSMQKLDKTLVAATGSQKSAAAMAKTLGMSFTDAHGKVLPMSQLLPRLSDKFASMPDGADKTALAMKLFGKSGSAMLPMLGKGAQGLADLRKESDKFGETVRNNAIDAVTKAKVSQRQWHAAMQGLKVQIGSALLPVLTKFVDFIRQAIIPFVQKLTGIVHDHQAQFQALGDSVMQIFSGVFSGFVMPILKALLPVLVKIAEVIGQNVDVLIPLAYAVAGIVTVLKAWAIAQAILNVVMEANPIMLVVTAIAALAAGLYLAWKKSETFRTIVKAVFGAVATAGKFMWENVLKPAFNALKIAFGAIFAALKWAWQNVGKPIYTVIKTEFRIVKDVVQSVVGILGAIFRGVFKGLKWAWDNVGAPVYGFIKSGIHTVYTVVKTVAGWIKNVFKSIGTALKWVYDHTIGPVIDTISSAISGLSDTISSVSSALDDLTGQTLDSGVTFGSGQSSSSGHGRRSNAQGTGYFGGGWTRINELGGESIVLPRGSRIRTHAETVSAGRGAAGGVNITLNVPGLFVDQAAAGRAMGKALEYAVNSGTRIRIKDGVV